MTVSILRSPARMYVGKTDAELAFPLKDNNGAFLIPTAHWEEMLADDQTPGTFFQEAGGVTITDNLQSDLHRGQEIYPTEAFERDRDMTVSVMSSNASMKEVARAFGYATVTSVGKSGTKGSAGFVPATERTSLDPTRPVNLPQRSILVVETSNPENVELPRVLWIPRMVITGGLGSLNMSRTATQMVSFAFTALQPKTVNFRTWILEDITDAS